MDFPSVVTSTEEEPNFLTKGIDTRIIITHTTLLIYTVAFTANDSCHFDGYLLHTICISSYKLIEIMSVMSNSKTSNSIYY